MTIDPKAEDDAIYVRHYHGSNRMLEERTGYVLIPRHLNLCK